MKRKELLIDTGRMYRLTQGATGQLFLEVVVGGFAMEDMVVPLSEEEQAAYAEGGKRELDDLAYRVCKDPDSFRCRSDSGRRRALRSETPQSRAESDQRQSHRVRVCYLAYRIAAFPLFLLSLLSVPLTILTWPHRADGVQEGPEPTDGEVIAIQTGLGAFAIVYVLVFLVGRGRPGFQPAWIPFVVQLPALLYVILVRATSSVGVGEAMPLIIYLAVLVVLLASGVIIASRTPHPHNAAA